MTRTQQPPRLFAVFAVLFLLQALTVTVIVPYLATDTIGASVTAR